MDLIDQYNKMAHESWQINFKDYLVQKTYREEVKQTQWRFEFPNGYGASVVRGPFVLGTDKRPYEVAVTKDRILHYDNPVSQGDIIGHLNRHDVRKILKEIMAIKKN